MIKVRYFLVRLFKETKSTSIRGRQLRRENETYLFFFFDFFFLQNYISRNEYSNIF